MSAQRRIIVVAANDPALTDLGGLPSPMLLDLCNDGRAHEAWPMSIGESGAIQWRARDDAYDADHKPAGQPYVMVMAGLNPRYRDDVL